MKSLLFLSLHAIAAQALPSVGDVVCRYSATTPSVVNYYTCTQLALKYLTSVENFFKLNPDIDPDCENIKPSTEYCVIGYIQYPISTDGFCGPKYGDASCSGTDFQCCNAETWKCGNAMEDCAPGTCWEGTCIGFPSEYSMDGKCGPAADGLLCGGKWGDCCSKDGLCGTGDALCSFENCYSGNCTIPKAPTTKLPWQTGNTPDGTCGGANGYTCDVVFGNCCGANGICGVLVEHCGSGCQPDFGICSVSGSPTTTSTIAPRPTDLSPDGTCGGFRGYKCAGSGFGNCCSSRGWCGSSADHCGAGCQVAFGTCAGASRVSPDGRCGGPEGYTCVGSGFGSCCSASGYCGDSIDHCAQGCQTDFSTRCLTKNVPTLDGTCGIDRAGYTCAGGSFDGQCCSASGFCGLTKDHCGGGCQPEYGKCS